MDIGIIATHGGAMGYFCLADFSYFNWYTFLHSEKAFADVKKLNLHKVLESEIKPIRNKQLQFCIRQTLFESFVLLTYEIM